MKPIAIHHPPLGFAKRWIDYCERHAIPYRKVSCYNSDIVERLRGCSALIWHCNHENYKDQLIAKQLMQALEQMDILLFPDINSLWHFDDKIAQKYLCEAAGIPMPDTHVFFTKTEATEWARNAEYPLVFKLRVGSGSTNVKLVKRFSAAGKLINRAFSGGFEFKSRANFVKDRFDLFTREKNAKNFKNFAKSVYKYFFGLQGFQFLPRENGYVIFQEFLPDNPFDTRLIVIGEKCFGVRRYNRKNDFRASGSGLLEYEPDRFDLRCVRIAFETARKLSAQSLALDFLFDRKGEPVVVEMSFAFPTGSFTDDCLGYWDPSLNWHEGGQNLQYLIMEELLAKLSSRVSN